jgi:hypothetical protein
MVKGKVLRNGYAMRKPIRIWLVAGLLLAAILGNTARAHFVPFLCYTNHPWSFDYTSATLNLWEDIEVISYDEVLMSGTTVNNSTFHVTKTITNNSGLSWTAYELTLSGADAAFDYTNPPTSDYFLPTVTLPQELVFSGGTPVSPTPPGNMVKLDFDINVTTNGLFMLTLTQNPVVAQNLIPEPATICLLGLGALSLIRRKK